MPSGSAHYFTHILLVKTQSLFFLTEKGVGNFSLALVPVGKETCFIIPPTVSATASLVKKI